MIILVLGHNGMLGHMACLYLAQEGYSIETTPHRWPSEEFKEAVKTSKASTIVNCIGAIPQKTRDFAVNFELPIWLSSNTDKNVVHPATDCEVDNDDYGISKRRATDFLLASDFNVKIIHTSIIGPELSARKSLFEWVLSQPDGTKIKGYKNQLWNGSTTLFWCQQATEIMRDWSNSPKISRIGSECQSKFDLICAILQNEGKSLEVEPHYLRESKNKCIADLHLVKPIKEQLSELRDFYSKHL